MVIRFIDMFCGIGGFRLGLEKANQGCQEGQEWQGEAGLQSNRHDIQRRGDKSGNRCGSRWKQGFSCIWSNDNDRYACRIYREHFGEVCEADIRTVDADGIPEHDLLCAGFPCQSFSIAGKRRGFEDTRGTLFFEICRVIRAKRPSYLLLENVRGLLSHDDGATFGIILTSLDELGYDCEWQVLNSKDFGVPQNRERVFIVGHIRGKPRPKVFPIGENNQGLIEGADETSVVRTLQGGAHSGGHHSGMTLLHNIYGGFGETKPRVFDEVSPTIRTPKGGGHIPAVAMRAYPRTGSCDKGRKQRLEYREDGLINALTGIEKDSMIVHNLQPRTGNPKEGGTGHLTRKDGIAYNLDASAGQAIEIAPSVTTEMAHGTGFNQTPKVVEAIGQIRRLTPLECERLQGFPDGWTKVGLGRNFKGNIEEWITSEISDTQRYKCLGNAVTVNAIEAIGRRLLEELGGQG